MISHSLDCFNCGLWTFGHSTLLLPMSLSFTLHSSPLSCQLSPSFLPSNLSFTQGQRHEESTGFPAEEEWIPRKQPSQQVRQIYEVSQVSGHFLAVCPCGCVWDCFPGLATTDDDLVWEDRHVGSSRNGSVVFIKWIREFVEEWWIGWILF